MVSGRLVLLIVKKREVVFMEFDFDLHLRGKTNLMKHLNLSIPQTSRIRRGFNLLSIAIACALMLATNRPSFCQTPSVKEQVESAKRRDRETATYGHTVSGIVKDAEGEPMAGTSIYLKGTSEGTTADTDGRFEFPRKLEEGDILTFSFIGYESVEYVVMGAADEHIEISMRENVIIIGDLAVEDAYTAKTGLRYFFRKIF